VAKVVEVNYVRSCSSTWPCFVKQYNKRKYIGIEFSEKFMAVKNKNKKVASSTIQDSGQTKFSDHLSSLFALECRHHLELAQLLGTRTPISRILETKDRSIRVATGTGLVGDTAPVLAPIPES